MATHYASAGDPWAAEPAMPVRPWPNATSQIAGAGPTTLLSALAEGAVLGPTAQPKDLRHDPSLHAPPPRDGRSTTANKASSTTSEFVRRKNWAQRIIEEIQDFLHVLSPTGDILFASPSIADLSGWTADELLSQPMRDFLHPTDAATYAREFARSIRDNVPITLYCRVRRKPTDGQVGDRFTVFEMAGRPYTGPAAYAALAAAGVDGYTDDSLMAVDENVHDLSAAGGGLGGSGAAAPVDPTRTAQVFLATGRPYPSKNAEMLDSFLDIKVENERLRAELNQLYAEIEASDDLKPSSSTSATSGGLTNALGQATLASPRTMHHPTMLELPPPPAPPTLHGVGALGIGVKPPPGEGSDRKRKAKVRDDADGDYVCRDCGCTDSPEWRKGPLGPKTLCNACGLRYAKKAKAQRNSGAPAPAASAAPIMPRPMPVAPPSLFQPAPPGPPRPPPSL